jgi:hypothetical protein
MISAAMEGGSWGDYDFDQQAIAMADDDNMEERTNEIIEQNDPIIKQIIIDELEHYSDNVAPKLSGTEIHGDSIWNTMQDYGGDFSDWLSTALHQATRNGWIEGMVSALYAHAIRTIEDTSSGYMGYGGKDVELEIQMEKSSRPELEENTCSIIAPIEEVLDMITAIDEHNDELGADWWTPYAVEHEGSESWDNEWQEDTYWDRLHAIQEFNASLNDAPKLHTGETFTEKYNKLKEKIGGHHPYVGESKSVNENKKVFNLAQLLTNTNSEKSHTKLHKVCARLGLSNEQCHAITSKAGYT